MSDQQLGNENPVVFDCDGKKLLGISHLGSANAERGVVIVVGGPQYRVGSHRQFLLLARGLAAQGIPVFRFDCRGMGDGEGQFPGFDAIDNDIHAAINAFYEEIPSLKEIVIWGLCDGASAASFYAYKDERVTGLILVNPWIRTSQGEAKAYLKHYYFNRLINKELWTKVFAGKFDFGGSIHSLWDMCKKTVASGPELAPEADNDNAGAPANTEFSDQQLPERFYQSLNAFSKPILLIISGNDLTAAEFMDVINKEKRWKKLIKATTFQQKSLLEADHTFSNKIWMDWVIRQTAIWLKSCG